MRISLIAFIFWTLLAAGQAGGHEEGPLRVAVVGDTGIGERAFVPGFEAVVRAMRERQPDVLLHLGDFVYQPEWFPESCPDRYMAAIETMLVRPFPVRVFVTGDNDLPPVKRKPKASGCWDRIAPLATSFDETPPGLPRPRSREGAMRIGNALFLVMDFYPWRDPAPWAAPLIRQAKAAGMWVVAALHEPPFTTAWHHRDRDGVRRQVQALAADLVLSGNQHSYERFVSAEVLKRGKTGNGDAALLERGQGGTVYVVSGGGGATFKPFADQQKNAAHTAPQPVFDMLAKRALMHHFVMLEIGRTTLRGTVFRVCPGKEAEGNPRWRPGKPFWHAIPLACDSQPAGTTVFDRFEIRQADREEKGGERGSLKPLP